MEYRRFPQKADMAALGLVSAKLEAQCPSSRVSQDGDEVSNACAVIMAMPQLLDQPATT